ncbi:MAG: hypothetical protein H6737_19030 [Alphaproteobacteria bacterium]|nr:hypothetical protein [Alphaproteobacteria bacterium]
MDLAALREAALEAPDRADAWEVLGDALQAEGDPRGRLIALQVALERDAGNADLVEAERRYRFEHRQSLYGGLLGQVDPWRVSWRFGFACGVQTAVDRRSEQAAATLDTLDLFALRELTLMAAADFDAVVQWLSTRDWPLLDALLMGPLNPGGGSLSVPLAAFLARAPRLTRLRVERPKSLDGLAHPGVEDLALSLFAEQVPALDLSGLPALRTLTLHLRGAPDPAVLRDAIGDRPVRLRLYTRIDGLDRLDVELATVPDPSSVPLLTPPEQERGQRFHQRSRFWSIRRRGNALVATEGKIGRPGLSRDSFHGKPYEAARELRKQVAARRAEGWREVYV